MNTLPTSIVAYILSFLNIYEIRNVKLISKYFYNVSFDRNCYHTILLDRRINQPLFHKLSISFYNVIRFNVYVNMDQHCLITCINNMPNIESLYIYTYISDETMIHIGRLTKLKNLHLNNTNISNAGIKSLQHLKLSTLYIEQSNISDIKPILHNDLQYISIGSDMLCNDMLYYIADICVNLEYINLSGCKLITDDGFIYLCKRNKSIRKLYISSTNLTEYSIKYCSSLPLTVLDIKNIFNIPLQIIIDIINKIKLKYLFCEIEEIEDYLMLKDICCDNNIILCT